MPADGPDYLRLPLAWTPSRRFEHDRVYEYRLAIGAGDAVVLRLVADKGWAMTVTHGSGQPDTDRGLFGTPHDALMVLVAEFAFIGDQMERRRAGSGAESMPAERP
jgi:hypothetical protein